MTRWLRESRRLAGEVALLGVLAVVFGWIHRYDWGQPFTKLLCYGVLFALVLLAEGRTRPALSIRLLVAAEITVLVAALVLGPARHAIRYAHHVGTGPRVDIGVTTQQAASVFLRDGENPYTSARVYSRPELARRYPGFHYGPVMFLGYAASAFSASLGLKLTSLLYLAASVLVLAALAWARAGPTVLAGVGGVLFFLVAALLPQRLWYELLRQGATDFLPVFLLALVFYCLHSGRWLGAGLCLGLSLSAKLAPALFLLVVLVRRRTPRRLYAGVLLGVAPMAVFLLWDFRSALYSIFLVRLATPIDSTSLYTITPRALRFVFPLVQLAAVVVTFARNFDRPFSESAVLRSFLLLTIVEMAANKQVHTNHFVWIVPFVALLLAEHRYLAGGAASRILGRAPASADA